MIQVNDELKGSYLEKIANLIINGEVAQNVTNTTTTTIIKDSEDNVLRTITKNTETRRTTILPTPVYIMDLVARSMSVQSCIDLLINHGYLVIDPTNKPSKEEKTKTLTDKTVNELKQRILGIGNRSKD